MKSVLMVAYLFPPAGGAGVQRTLKFVKYLPAMGWRPLVLTVWPDQRRSQDPGLLDEIPEQAKVLRTRAIRLPAALPFRLRDWIRRWLLVIDEHVGWLPFAVSAGLRWIDELRPDAIYSTSSPYTGHLVARQLSQRSRLPWVADFRDPWVAGFSDNFPTRLHRRLALAQEARVFEQADHIILNTQRALDFYSQRYPHLPSSRLLVIPNGFDMGEMVASVDQDPLPGRPFTLVHSGTLYQKSRSGRGLVQAVRTLVESDRLPASSISLHFFGNLDPGTRQEIDTAQLGEVIRQYGYVSHRESLVALRHADLLVLIPSAGTGSELYIPAKLYEYLAAGKPILALAEPGAAADLVEELRAGVVVAPGNVNAIAEAIFQSYNRWLSNEPTLQPDLPALARFDRQALTTRLAQLLDSLTGVKR